MEKSFVRKIEKVIGQKLKIKPFKKNERSGCLSMAAGKKEKGFLTSMRN